MKLGKDEEKILTDWGCTMQDVEQIKRLSYKFTLYYKHGGSTKISTQSAKEKLTIQNFLSGLERAAFHRTSYRETIDKKYEGILIESNVFDY